MTTTNITTARDVLGLLEGTRIYREAGEYWMVSDANLEALGAMLAQGDRDAYSLWCAGPDGGQIVHHVGWQRNGQPLDDAPEGYAFECYFEGDTYTGPDPDGVEPTFA